MSNIFVGDVLINVKASSDNNYGVKMYVVSKIEGKQRNPIIFALYKTGVVRIYWVMIEEKLF